MAQHDYVLSNQSLPAFRSDLNNALAAVVTQNSGAAQPSTTYAYMPWSDTTTGIFKIRNAANNGWISLFRLDGTFSFLPPEDGEVTLAKLADGVLAASAAGLLKMADGYLAASTAGRAKMADGFLTTPKYADSSITPTKLSQPLTQVAAVTATGTAVDFTGIPSWVKRVTVMFNGLSSNGNSAIEVRLGTSAGIKSTGYNTFVFSVTSPNSVAYGTSSTGVSIIGATAVGGRLGSLVFTSYGGTIWTCAGTTSSTDGPATGSVNSIFDLSGTLDRVRITAVNGTDAFDAGSVSILYEG